MVYKDPNIKEHRFGDKRLLFVVILIAFALYCILHRPTPQPELAPVDVISIPIKQDAQTPVNMPSDSKDIGLAFRVSGRVAQMMVRENTEVKKGDLLAVLEKTPFEEALATAQAQLQMAQAQYNQSLHLPPANFNGMEAARAAVETAQYDYDTAHSEMEKRKALVVSRHIAGEIDNVYNDDVQNDHDTLVNLQQKRRELTHQEDIASYNNAGRDVEKAAVQTAQTNLATAETNLADTELLAPAAGMIKSQVSLPGASVSAGMPVYILSVFQAPKTNP